MSEVETEKQEKVELPTYKFSDDVIAIVRELVQLSLLTGTNIIDHLRAVVLVPDSENQKYLTLDEEYVKSYNAYITHLNEAALQQAQEMQGKEAEVEA
jgi:hypothetical protein